MPILEVKGLVKYYGRRKVVAGVDFEVNEGEVVGLLGPNGAGKTTSFRMTTGQVTPDGGVVRFTGQDVTRLPMYRRARLGMGYLSQETSVFRKLSVEQNILAVLEMMPQGAPSRRQRYELTDRVLDQFGLARLKKNNAARLSGGEKRRLEIARCLVCNPKLILLDEPFTGIDPKTIADIQQIVRKLRKDGIAILLTDHNVRETLRITDRSYLIKDGQVRTHGTPQHIVHDPVAIEEYLGAGFHDTSIGPPPDPPPVADAPAPAVPHAPALAPEAAVHQLLEQEKVHRLVERLKTQDHAAAAAELVQRGLGAVPSLFEALERRDVEIRRQAQQVLQTILGGDVPFDPYAPEAQRRQQLADLRERWARKAGLRHPERSPWEDSHVYVGSQD